MPHFNFLPSIEEVKFIQSQTGNNNIDEIYEFEEVFELAMEFTIGGLKYLENPLRENEYVPFYLNTITYTQRGTRDTVIHGLISEYFDERYSNTNNQKRFVTLTKFRRSERDDGNVFDFIQNIYFVEIFVTNKKITTKEELAEVLKSKYQENVLFKTKIPYVNKAYFENPNNNGGFENG